MIAIAELGVKALGDSILPRFAGLDVARFLALQSTTTALST
jgi:hypothetical protein